jgi:hypothetical protein
MHNQNAGVAQPKTIGHEEDFSSADENPPPESFSNSVRTSLHSGGKMSRMAEHGVARLIESRDGMHLHFGRLLH